MEGKLFFTILGLLVSQALLSVLMSMSVRWYVIELVVAAWFVLVSLVLLFIVDHSRHVSAVAFFSFLVGLLNVVFLSFFVLDAWLVVMLCLGIAGLLLSFDGLAPPRKRRADSGARKGVLVKDVPAEPAVKVEVYGQPAPLRKVPRKRAAKASSARKRS